MRAFTSLASVRAASRSRSAARAKSPARRAARPSSRGVGMVYCSSPLWVQDPRQVPLAALQALGLLLPGAVVALIFQLHADDTIETGAFQVGDQLSPVHLAVARYRVAPPALAERLRLAEGGAEVAMLVESLRV